MNRISIVALAVLALAGCKEAPSSSAPQTSASAGAPDAKPGVKLDSGMIVLPAVKGNPAGAYFNLTNTGAAAVTLAAVAVNGAEKAEMHETKGGTMVPMATLELKPGERVAFERGGRHVMAFGLADTIKPGSDVELTLTFADGDKLSGMLKAMPANAAGHGAMH